MCARLTHGLVLVTFPAEVMVPCHPLHCVRATLGTCSVPGRTWGPQGLACGVDEHERESGPDCAVQEAVPWVAPGS